MLLLATALSLLAGGFVAVFGEERRVRGWFLILCVSTALLTTGLWVELYRPEYAFFAARLNVTMALVLAFTGSNCALIMCGARWYRLPLFALAVDEEFQSVVDAFSDEMRGVIDEPTMRVCVELVCTGPLEAESVELLDADALAEHEVVAKALETTPLIECEILRRQGVDSSLVSRAEVIVPLRHHNVTLGALPSPLIGVVDWMPALHQCAHPFR